LSFQVYFRKEIRVTIQQTGYAVAEQLQAIGKGGTNIYQAGSGLAEQDLTVQGLFDREDDWSSCAYFYLDTPEDKVIVYRVRTFINKDPCIKRLEKRSSWALSSAMAS